MQVTIFEAKDVVGGMMRLVPVFRLPWDIIQKDVDRITALGVEIKLEHPIARPPEMLLQEGFDAVYVACGFQRDTTLNIEGMELPDAPSASPVPGLFAALDLLDRVRRGERPDLGSKVLVIGGGDTAMDAARVAQRLTGNPATIVYRRTGQEMPASAEEKDGAFEEGSVLHVLATPIRVIQTQDEDSGPRIAALECVRNELGEPDASGRRRPIPVEGSEFQIEADSIIVAIGQSPDIAFLDGSAVSLHKWGAIQVDPETGQAGVPCVYAGGDVVDGPESIIAACADGRRAAEAICARFAIEFEPFPANPAALSEEEIVKVKRVRARKVPQHRPEMLPPAERGGFELIEATFSEEAAQSEALRCVQCSTFCDKCVEVCPNRANYTYRISPVRLMVPQLSSQDGSLVVSGHEPFEVRQERQIIHVDDFCNECGNCATFCVHHGKPYTEKPRLFLRETDFLLEEDNAFFIAGMGAGHATSIRRREGGVESRLSRDSEGFSFENAQLRVRLRPKDGTLASGFDIQEMTLIASFPGTWSLAEAAEMALILEGISTTLPAVLAGS